MSFRQSLAEKVSWFSSDPSVATIDSEGNVTALKKENNN